MFTAYFGMSSSDDEDLSVCASCCMCWSGTTSSRDERGPLVGKYGNGKARTPNSRPRLRLSWVASGISMAIEASDTELTLKGGSTLSFRGGRYTVGVEAGRGAHCVVWQCQRVGTRKGEPRLIALKVHNEDSNALRREANALKALRATREGADLFPALLGTVRLGSRTGLALSLHGPDLYQLQKARDRRPFPSSFVWGIARQLLGALAALEQVELVHADIKPQNILLHEGGEGSTLDGGTRVVLIDLGSCLGREQLSRTTSRVTYVQSRWYRAPEVILWAQVGYPADAWSVGCVVAEVALGVPLLPGESEFNQLARTTAMLGAPPQALLRRANRVEPFFVADATGRHPPVLLTARVVDEPELVHYLPYAELSPLLAHVLSHYAEDERRTLLELLDGLLRWDPDYRWNGPFATARLWRTTVAKIGIMDARSSEI